jgi:dGTP triphosphohydrolase
MGKKKTPSAGEPRKPFKVARIRIVLADAVDRRTEHLAQDFTQYVNDAVRMRLEAEGAWPPPPPRK